MALGIMRLWLRLKLFYPLAIPLGGCLNLTMGSDKPGANGTSEGVLNFDLAPEKYSWGASTYIFISI
jgi:hypothetical protein